MTTTTTKTAAEALEEARAKMDPGGGRRIIPAKMDCDASKASKKPFLAEIESDGEYRWLDRTNGEIITEPTVYQRRNIDRHGAPRDWFYAMIRTAEDPAVMVPVELADLPAAKQAARKVCDLRAAWNGTAWAIAPK